VSADFPVVCQVRESVAELSFTNILALSFLLLNIDTGPKHAVMQSETPMQQEVRQFLRKFSQTRHPRVHEHGGVRHDQVRGAVRGHMDGRVHRHVAAVAMDTIA
jgi:hypothetical protein